MIEEPELILPLIVRSWCKVGSIREDPSLLRSRVLREKPTFVLFLMRSSGRDGTLVMELEDIVLRVEWRRIVTLHIELRRPL